MACERENKPSSQGE